MANFLDRLIGRGAPSSAHTAKERLKLVLIHDRADISPGLLETMRDDLVSVISKHVGVDRDAVRLRLTHDRHESRLVADIPLVPARRRHS